MKFEAGINYLNKRDKNEVSDEELLAKLSELVRNQESAEISLDLQQQKESLMTKLHESLAQLDATETVGLKGAARAIQMENDRLYYFGKGGVKTHITEGQLFASARWGAEHYLDVSLPRALKKKYLIEKARHEIAELHDRQIAGIEMNQTYNKNTGRDDAYRAIYERDEETLPDGIIAERMVQSFLTRIAHDYDMPFKIVNVSVHEDVEYKIDFIIEPLNADTLTGVDVQNPEDRHDVGIQFTTANSRQTIKHKERQLENSKREMARSGNRTVDNLVLVTLPITEVREKYGTWREASTSKKPAGGPEELWSIQTKEQVFKELLSCVLPEKTVTTAWDTVQRENT